MPSFPDPDARLVLDPDCERCPALADCRTEIAWGNGPHDAAVVVVGEAPAAGDPSADRWRGGNRTGMAYTSRASGRKIRDLLADAGYPDAFYTNAVKCYPSDGAGSNREPTAAELETCRDHLLTELDRVDPTVVVTTGAHATRSVLAAEGDAIDGFLDAVLDPVACESLGVTCLPLLHPSYQEVWLSRLGHDRDSYVGAVRDALDVLTGA